MGMILFVVGGAIHPIVVTSMIIVGGALGVVLSIVCRGGERAPFFRGMRSKRVKGVRSGDLFSLSSVGVVFHTLNLDSC